MLLLTDIDNAAEKRLISCICCKIGENDFVNLLWNIFQALYDKLLEKMINLNSSRQTPCYYFTVFLPITLFIL